MANGVFVIDCCIVVIMADGAVVIDGCVVVTMADGVDVVDSFVVVIMADGADSTAQWRDAACGTCTSVLAQIIVIAWITISVNNFNNYRLQIVFDIHNGGGNTHKDYKYVILKNLKYKTDEECQPKNQQQNLICEKIQ